MHQVFVFKWFGCDTLPPIRHYYQHFYFNIHGRFRYSNFGNFTWQLELSFLARIKRILKDRVFFRDLLFLLTLVALV